MSATHDHALSVISDLMRDLFDEHEGAITRETTGHDVAQWDSLSNVQLIIMIEQELGVRFSSTEVQSFRNLGDLVDAAVRYASR